MTNQYRHTPVLLAECLEHLNLKPQHTFVDSTLGGAGHSSEVAKRLGEGGLLIGIDQDEMALAAAKKRLSSASAENACEVMLLRGNFGDLDELLVEAQVPGIDAILFDLGVSSPQLDHAERGFSYHADAPLDMRMDQTDTLTARAVVNEWPQEELRRILFEYGEERYAPAIARHILERREKAPIETTGQLVEVIRSAMPPAALREKQHPRQAELSGHPHRCQRRAGGAAAHAACSGAAAASRRGGWR